MKLPNGYGTVYKISGKRRNPWLARKTVGWDENGNQIRQTIGAYRTQSEALQALADFNENPYDLKASKLTFEQAYDLWFRDQFNDESNRSTVKNYRMAYQYCKPIYKIPIGEIKTNKLQPLIDSCEKGYQTQTRIKTLLRRVFEWCIAHEILRKNYADFIKINEKKETHTRNAFPREDICRMASLADESHCLKIVMMLIYSGVRINELLELKKDDVYLDLQYFFVRKSKTDSGVRAVPIADAVLPYWKHFDKLSTCNYAVCTVSGQPIEYSNFVKRYWNPTMEELGLKDYTPHCTRHTCTSLLKVAGVDHTLVKKIIGHKSQMDLTESTYTHYEIKDLLRAINSIDIFME